MIDKHDMRVTHNFVVHYPEHGPREGDPHYKDFEAYRKANIATAKCDFAVESGVTSECSGGLELHHSHIEFALTNGVDLSVLERVYPGVSDPNSVGAWVESGANFEWLCEWHHRGAGGKHRADVSNYEAEKFVRGLISAS